MIENQAQDTMRPSVAERESTETVLKKRRIWFFGHFGVDNDLGNFGNESTFEAALYNVRQFLPEAEICSICTAPAVTAKIHEIKTLPISRPMMSAWAPKGRLGRMVRSFVIGVPCEILRWIDGALTLKSTDVLLVPGTGLISDAYGFRGWGPYSVFKWSVIAKLRGCKLLFVSVGAGPIYSRLGRFFIKSALSLADFRSYRDRSSLEFLESIGFRNQHDRVCPDLAFSLPGHLIAQKNGTARRRRVIGLGLMLYAGKYSVERPSDATPRNYLESLVPFVRWLLDQKYDVRLLIGDLCDRPVIEEFKHLLRERLPSYGSDRILDDKPASVEELLYQLAETDLVVATRFHNVLLAILMNKPVVALSFHHKVTSLMEATGLSDYCLDIHNFSGEDLISKVRDVESHTENLTALIKTRAGDNRSALEEQYQRIRDEIFR